MIRLYDALERRLKDRQSGKAIDSNEAGDPHQAPAAYRARTDHLPGGPWAEDPTETDLRELDDLPSAHPARIEPPISSATFAQHAQVAPRPRYAMFALCGLLIFVSLALYGALAGAGASSDTFQVARGNIRKVVSARGRVEPVAEVRVSASTLGRIAAVMVNEGDTVVEGQALAQMDDSELRAQVAQAAARLEEALARLSEIELGARPEEVATARAREREAHAVQQDATEAFERARVLSQGGLIATAELDTARGRREVAAAQYQGALQQLALVEAGSREEVKQAARAHVKSARADADYARALLDQTTIRAPMSGKIIHRFMNPGEVISLQRPQPIVTLADTSRIQVRAEVDETDARFIKAGQSVTLTSGAVRGREFAGTVTEVGSTAGRKSLLSENPAEPVDTRVVEAIVALSDSYAWTFGTNVDVIIKVDHRDDVLVVPHSAVRQVDGKAVVTVRQGDADTARPVQLGVGDDAFVEIVGGLKDGDMVLR